MAAALKAIDVELAKLACALHAAVMDEDHQRQAVLWADIGDLLERRHTRPMIARR